MIIKWAVSSTIYMYVRMYVYVCCIRMWMHVCTYMYLRTYMLWPSLGKSTISAHQLKSIFACTRIQEIYIHAISRNTNCLTIDGQVCFYRRLFTDAVKPQGCISWSWGTLIRLHGVPNCSSRQSWPSLWIVSVHVTYWRYSTALWVRIGALPCLWLPTCPHHPPHPL